MHAHSVSACMVYRLCLDTTHKTQITSEVDDDLVPPLELCIKTWLVTVNVSMC